MSKTRSDLKGLLKSFEEALKFWQSNTSQSTSSLSEITAAEVAEPLEELVKLSKLIKAHTTKVGIIFKPETLINQYDTAFNTLSKLSETIILLISILIQLKPEIISQIFYDEILNQIKLILDSNRKLVVELLVLEEQIQEDFEKDGTKSGSDKEKVDGRLVSVGKVWSNCDSLVKLVQNGKLGLLSTKIKQSIILIEDGLDEFAEWAENPNEFDIDDDPFGFSGDDSDIEDENPPAENDVESDVEEANGNKKELIEFSKKWLAKFRLIKLLLSSLTKSLPSVTSGETINIIYNTQRNLVITIDKLIVDLMLDQTIDEEVENYGKEISKNCSKLVKVVQEVNKSNENKIKWCVAWTAKFKEDS